MRNGSQEVRCQCPSCGKWHDARQMVPQLRATGSGFEIEAWFWCKPCWLEYVEEDGGCSLSRDKLLRGLHRWSEMLQAGGSSTWHHQSEASKLAAAIDSRGRKGAADIRLRALL